VGMQEWEVSKARQDRQLENIEQGLGTLGEIATAMGENLNHQDVLIDQVNEKVSGGVGMIAQSCAWCCLLCDRHPAYHGVWHCR